MSINSASQWWMRCDRCGFESAKGEKFEYVAGWGALETAGPVLGPSKIDLCPLCVSEWRIFRSGRPQR